MRTVTLWFIIFSSVFLLHCCKKSTSPENDNGETEFVTCPQVDIPWPSLADSPWPMFHHDPQHTGRSNFTGPLQGAVEWISDSTIGSKLTTVVYIGEDGSLFYFISDFTDGDRLVSLTSDGRVQWEYNFPNKGRVGGRSAILSSSGILYISCSNGYFYGFNVDGSLYSSTDIGILLLTLTIGIDGSFYGTDDEGTLFAIGANGNILWSSKEDDGYSITDSPMISPDGLTLYIAGIDSGLYALSTNGGKLWYNNIEGRKIRWSSFVDNQGHIYINPDGPGMIPGEIFCLNTDGTMRWRYEYAGFPSFNSITMDKEGFIYVLDVVNRRLISLDYEGQFRWECYFPSGVERYVASHLTCDSEGNIYVINSDSQPSVFSVGSDGIINWTVDLTIGSINTDCQPTISGNGKLLLTADRKKIIVSIK